MKGVITRDNLAIKRNSSYYAVLEREFIRMYGKEKGRKVANNF
jgi:hypothetical protein